MAPDVHSPQSHNPIRQQFHLFLRTAPGREGRTAVRASPQIRHCGSRRGLNLGRIRNLSFDTDKLRGRSVRSFSGLVVKLIVEAPRELADLLISFVEKGLVPAADAQYLPGDFHRSQNREVERRTTTSRTGHAPHCFVKI